MNDRDVKNLNNNLRLCDSRNIQLASRILLLLIPAALAVWFLANDAALAFAQETPGDYIINRVEIWGLFYRLMVIAFTVGAVLMGVLAYVVFKFRESNKKTFPRETMEGRR